MTTDSALSHHPTESLILPTKRRFFPFKIPNFHVQLRNYISTADPDRIYVVVDRVIYSIHISSEKREPITVIPFEPKCLAAGNGWIGVGGSDNGECAFIKIADRNARVHDDTPAPQTSDVDSALPIDLELPSRASTLRSDEEPGASHSHDAGRDDLPDVQLHKFGGTIVNSITIHRLPGDEKGLADEDIVVLSNNDKTVTVYSLTRSKVLKALNHQACMNYAIMSPDSSILAAVGDETCAYFYDVTRDFDTNILMETGERLTGWNWDLLRCVEMDIGTRFDDGCCFTVAFSQFSRLCAIGSQSGVITVFDVKTIRDIFREPNGKNSIICHFNSSRLCCNGGAVRCMTFAPEPWDLLVWLEDKGRAGIADVRQAFIRRQILNLDMDEPGIQEVPTEPLLDELAALGLDLDGGDINLESPQDFQAARRAVLDPIDSLLRGQRGNASANSPLREGSALDLAERETLIAEYSRWTSRLQERMAEQRAERRTRANANSHSVTRSRYQGPTDVPNQASRPTSPLRHGESPHDHLLERYTVHTGNSDRMQTARLQTNLLLSQRNSEASNQIPEMDGSLLDVQPSITLSWTASPAEMRSTTPGHPQRSTDSSPSDPSTSSNEAEASSRPRGMLGRPSANFDYSTPATDLAARPRTHQRSHSRHQQPEGQDGVSETRPEAPPRLTNSELRTSVTAERLRRQRHIITEAQNRNNQREQLYRRQLLDTEQNRSPRWMRSILNDLPDRGLGAGQREQDTGSTAGIGWGADGRTLYIATVDGIFEYQLNIRDRKTFPVISYR